MQISPSNLSGYHVRAMPSGSENEPRDDLPGRLGLALVVVVAAVLFTLLVFVRGELWCVDGYYHIRSAQILTTQGISRTFPWWQETFLRFHWADKDFLYHLLLIPFSFGNLTIGAKAAAVVFATGMIVTFHEVLRRLRVPAATALTLALMAYAPMLLARLAYPRSFVLAITLSLAGTAAIVLGRTRVAAGIAGIYAWAHVSYHLLPCVALLHDLHRPREEGARSFHMTAWTLGGMTAGIIVNPFFPNNVRLWWVQNIEVLTVGWAAQEDLRLGLELLPPAANTLISLNLGIFLVFVAALWRLARGTTPSPEAGTLLLVSSGFLALSFRSVLFLEFAFPFTMLFAGIVLRDWRATARGATSPAWVRRVAMVAIAGVSVLLAARTAVTMVGLALQRKFPDFERAAGYLRDHAPDGETIFHLDWDEFPQLYFYNPQLRYLVGLDPTFMLATDPARWRRYREIALGEVADAYEPIRREFRCRYVFATADDADFLLVARRDPRFVEAYRDLETSVFELTDDDAPRGSWRVVGYWPDPARKLFGVRLDREGGSATSAGVRVEASGFVDLSRVLALPGGRSEACAFAERQIERTSRGPVNLGIASDDEIRVWIGDEEVYARSPIRTPRPGTPGGPPLSLDELGSAVPDTAERTIKVTLAPGPNRIVVQACRVGQDFGFFMRVREGGD